LKKRTVVIVLAALAAVLSFSGAASGPPPQEAVPVPAPAVITGPPSGWTTRVNISNNPGDSELPMLAVDDSGKAYACWEELSGGDGDPRYMLFNTNYSGSWGQSQGRVVYYFSSETGFPAIACDPTSGAAYMSYQDGDLVNMNYEIMFREYAKGVLTTEEWASKTPYSSSYSSLAVNPVDKFLYCMWIEDYNESGQYELAYRWRNPATKQWGSINYVPVFSTRSKYWRDLTIDAKGTAHLVFILRGPAAVYYTKNPTPQNPNTWTTPITIDGDTGRDWMAPRIAADKDGDVYLIWYHNTGGYESQTEEVYFKKTLNGVWQATENLSNNPTRSEGGCVTVNPDTKDIYVAWHELAGGGNWEVYYRTFESQTPGAAKSWGDIYNFTNNAGHSGEPSLKRDAMGGLHLVYHDETANGTREIYYMYKRGITLTITSPNGGESWEALRSYPITWTTLGTVANVKIEYSTDGGATYTTIIASTPNTGTYTWTVPNVPSTTCRIRVSEASTGSPADTSDANFTLARPSILPPVSLALATSLNSSRDRKTNALTWTANPENSGVTVSSYKVWRKPATAADSAFIVMGSVAGAVTQYAEADLDILTKYAYRVTSVSSLGGESIGSSTVVETQKFEFPPVGVAVTTIANKVLFNQIKDNTIYFSPSPYNPDADVAGYDVYRRKTSEGDGALALIKSLDAATFSYKDAGLKGGAKHAYAVKTRYTDGRLSDFSTIVSER
jgi:hypothetical protein